MAGIGVKLTNIFEKNTITTNLLGFGYSMSMTVTPMFTVIGTVIIMQNLLGFMKIGYAQRELFACTLLYMFIFSLITASPFNSVLSRYLSDVIYEETYEDILPCFYVGIICNLICSCILGIPFCIWEYIVGKVSVLFVLAGYCGYVSLVMVFYAMLYLSICKDYKKISFFFLLGSIFSILVTIILNKVLQWETTISMLVGLDAGFIFIASLEFAVIRSYFRQNSRKYKPVLSYFSKFWKLMLANFLYTLGMYVHNFVFWTTDMRMVVADTFVSNTNYDMATCLGMFTNITCTVIFISRVEMYFHERYKAYSEAVIGGRGRDIELAKNRMFRQLSEELLNLVRIQFIISNIVFFLCMIILPKLGFGGQILRIYPCMAAGYFILFIMYAAIIFLYYYNDLNGALMTTSVFMVTTVVVSIIATGFEDILYGFGLTMGSFLGFCVAYYRLRWIEKNLDIHIFCNGTILKRGKGKKPSAKVFDRYEEGKNGNG